MTPRNLKLRSLDSLEIFLIAIVPAESDDCKLEKGTQIYINLIQLPFLWFRFVGYCFQFNGNGSFQTHTPGASGGILIQLNALVHEYYIGPYSYSEGFSVSTELISAIFSAGRLSQPLTHTENPRSLVLTLTCNINQIFSLHPSLFNSEVTTLNTLLHLFPIVGVHAL